MLRHTAEELKTAKLGGSSMLLSLVADFRFQISDFRFQIALSLVVDVTVESLWLAFGDLVGPPASSFIRGRLIFFSGGLI